MNRFSHSAFTKNFRWYPKSEQDEHDEQKEKPLPHLMQ